MKTRRIRINSKPPEKALIFAPALAVEINAEAEVLPEWIELAPYGEHPTREGDAVQRFNAESAAQIVAWFNFFPRRLARLARLNAVKVYVGHPDFAPGEWPERIDLGEVVELEAREDALHGKIRWNASALEHVKTHKHPSVAWDVDADGSGVETPVMLWSVGMWHKPNIKTVKPVINAAGYDESETNSEPDDAGDEPEQPQPETNMLNKIMEALKAAGIVKDGDSEDSVLAQIGSMISSLAYQRERKQMEMEEAAKIRTAINAEPEAEVSVDDLITRLNSALDEASSRTAERDHLSERLNAAEQERDSERAARINALLDRAIETGRLDKSGEDEAREQLAADLEAGTEALFAKPVRINTKPLTLGGTKPAVMAAHERMTRLNSWLDKWQAAHPGKSRDEAWKASEADAEMQGIHEAMKQADAERRGGD